MKNYRTISKLNNLFLCCCILLGSGVFIGGLHGQVTTQEKIRLMSEALAAREAGNLEEARDNLQRLVEMDPDDPGLRRLLESVEQSIAEQQPAASATPVPAVPGASTPAETLTPAPSADAGGEAPSPAAALTAEQAAQLQVRVDEAMALQGLASQQANEGNYADAIASLEMARAELPVNAVTAQLHQDIERDLAEAHLGLAQSRLAAGDLAGARSSLQAYSQAAPGDQRARQLEADLYDPSYVPIDEASPGFVEEQQKIKEMIRIGRAQYLNGDIIGAESTFRQVEAVDVYNAEAKAMLNRIAQEKSRRNHLDRSKTRSQMIEEVGLGWQRPQIFIERPEEAPDDPEPLPLEIKLSQITIPTVNFSGMELSRVVTSLSQISREYDSEGEGVNIVLMDPDRTEPLVYINVRDLSLKRILDLIVDSVNFQYQVEEDAVIVRPGVRRRPDLLTENFPVSPATVRRIIGQVSGGQQEVEVNDPFAAPTESVPGAGQEAGPGGGGDSRALRDFLQQTAGVDFTIRGSNVFYDGTDLWVTQTQRNLERVRNIFQRLTDIRQVEIEARFLEVSQRNLDELHFQWQMVTPGGTLYQTSNRTLAQAFAGSQAASEIRVNDESFPIQPPQVPGGPDLGAGAANLAIVDGSIDGYDVAATIRALSQKTGSDLLSAPKVTVLNGHQAQIIVAQELRYPDSYGETQSEVGRGGSGEGGAAGVTITPGTPQDFQTRNVGVELTVTPTVEQDNSVTLELNPRVTEFQGFVEYGGLSIAVTSEQTVSNPSGFYQPIFATREVNTTVNIWDGATVVLGGLVREQVNRVEDKLPFFGDIPVLGRLFRSEGEGSEKRNLLIFVTANLVSPGGSPMRQRLQSVEPGAIYQNPTLVVPSGAVAREKREQ